MLSKDHIMTRNGSDLLPVARSGSRKTGQTMVEYLIMVAMIIASLAVLVVFLITFREYGGRILNLAGCEYP